MTKDDLVPVFLQPLYPALSLKGKNNSLVVICQSSLSLSGMKATMAGWANKKKRTKFGFFFKLFFPCCWVSYIMNLNLLTKQHKKSCETLEEEWALIGIKVYLFVSFIFCKEKSRHTWEDILINYTIKNLIEWLYMLWGFNELLKNIKHYRYRH